MPRLIITSGSASGPGRTVDLAGDPVTVGRDASNTVPLEGEGKASRRHCQIVPVAGGGYEVVDLQSTNGTRVNGSPVERRRLRHGDVVEVGLTHLKFEDERAVASGEASACFLEWTAGDKKGERVPLTAARTSFGRREGNTVVLQDKMASGHHAEVVKDLNGYTLRDLGSTNGTMVNGEPVTETALTHGARVRIGGSKFVFKDPSMADIEVALESVEEDDGGWGMMAELDVSKAGGGSAGVFVAFGLIAALAAGAWLIGSRPEEQATASSGPVNLVSDGGFAADEALAWTVDEGSPAVADKSPQGRPKEGACLSVRHDGKGSGRGLVRYADDLEFAEGTTYKVSAWMRRDGDRPALLAVQWVRAGNVASGATAVVQTVPVGSPAQSGAWAQVTRTVRRPAWAGRGRLVVVVPPETGAKLDDVRVEAAGDAGPRIKLDAPEVEGLMASTGGLDLVRTATVLFVGAAPWARMPDGRVVGGADAFRPHGAAESTADGAAVKGVLVDGTGEVPATLEVARALDGLVVTATVEGAKETGFAADFPVAHLSDGLGAQGAFGARKAAPQPGAALDGARRVLLGDALPIVEAHRPPTLVALDVAAEGGARLSTLAAADDDLLRVVLSREGSSASVKVVTTFDAERLRARQALAAAEALVGSTPGAGVRALDAVAQEFPFEVDVRTKAVERAQARRAEASKDVEALSEAITRFRVFGDEGSLLDAERRAEALAAQFPAEGSSSGTLELTIRDRLAEVKADRVRFELVRAAPEVRRLSRLAELLEQQAPREGEPDLKVLALAYFDAIVRRYGALDQAVVEGADAEVVGKIRDARAKRDALMGDPTVKARFPVLPE